MKPQQPKRKIIDRIFALTLIFLVFAPLPVLGKIRIPSANEVARDLENRYHINTGAMQNLGENFNVSSNKTMTPEVSIFFSPTDPKPGERVTAKAYTTFFTNPSEQLYYTWYLKRSGCDLDTIVGSVDHPCNANNSADKKITIDDWKAAATRIIFENGVSSAVQWDFDDDNDGYKAEYGGHGEQDVANDRCYVRDTNTGVLYELRGGANEVSFTCGNASHFRTCLQPIQNIKSTTCNWWWDSSCNTFDEDTDYIPAGSPSCVGNVPVCPNEYIARCVSNLNATYDTTNAGGTSSLTCTSVSTDSDGCRHLFPKTNGASTGGNDNVFNLNDEKYWGSDPHDPDTAGNGIKDEATVAGLGLDSFTWNYQPGDQVGLAVEGVSMIPTKHDNSTYMVMWAFSKNKCTVSGKGSYATTIRGYSVTIPTANMDLNDCLKDNLIDPTEGGQAEKLDLSVTYSPDNPVNDRTEEKSGDVLMAYATVNNSNRPTEEIFYEWKVEISDKPSGGAWADITKNIVDKGLVPSVKGNGLSSIGIALNLEKAFLDDPDGAGGGAPINLGDVNPFYFRITAIATENFSSGVSRGGKSDVIVRVSNTTKKIIAHTTKVNGDKVALSDKICDSYFPDPANESEIKENLNRIACRVAKNEVIGLKVESEGLTNFRWTINDTPLLCSKEIVSDDCAADGAQNEVAFFAATGNPGETYTIQFTGSDTKTGEAVVLSRTFQVVNPELMIVSDDDTKVWSKYIGQYTDLNGKNYDDYSEIAFETYEGNDIHLVVKSIPNWMLKNNGVSHTWYLDGNPIVIDGVAVNPASGIVINDNATDITIPASMLTKTAGEFYDISFSVDFIQSQEKRKVLENIWNMSALSSSEIHSATAIQVEVVEFEEIAKGTAKNFYAAVSEYIPSSVAFAIRLILTIGLLIFTLGFLFSLIPETNGEEVILSRKE